MSNQAVIRFNPKLPKLSKMQQKVLNLLVEAGELIAPIYLEQEKQLSRDGNFYPRDVSQKEIEKAVQKDPSILSPYTVVEKINGQIKAIPYHIKYKDMLRPVSDKLNEASKLTENKDFAKFLKLTAKALLFGNYEEPMATWFKMKPYILDISIGPFEHNDDRIFFAKAPYQCWVGVTNFKRAKELIYYKDIVLSARRKALFPNERFENYKEVKARVDDVVLFSGHMAKTRFVGINMPVNIDWVAKYGSWVTIFNQVNDLRMKEQILPTFNKIFAPTFKKQFSTEDLRLGSISYVALHEFAHNDLYYKNAAKNLQDLLSPIYELAATVLGFRMAGSLLLKDIITSKQLESMIIAFICRNFYLANKIKEDKSWASYALAGIIFNNFMLKSGALVQSKGLTIPNFMKIFISVQELFYALEFLLSSGTRKNAEAFIKKYDLDLLF